MACRCLRTPRPTGFIRLLCAFGIWSTWIVTLRVTGIGSLSVSFYSCLYATIIWAVAAALRQGPFRLPPSPRLGMLALIAAFFVLNMATYLRSLELLPAASAAFLHYLAPVFVAIGAPVLLRERVSRSMLAAGTVALCGMALVFSPALETGSIDMAGAAFAIISAVAYAGGVIASKSQLDTVGTIELLFFQNLFSTLLMLPLLPSIPFTPDANHLVVLPAIALVYSVIAPLLYLSALRQDGSIRVSLVGYVEPLGVACWGALLFGESMSAATACGGVLILLSGYWMTRGGRS